MNEIKKIITLFFVIYAVYSLYVRCQANPGGRSCDFVKSWRSLMRLRVDITEFVSFILLYAAVERYRELLEEADEDDLPEIEEEQELQVEDNLWPYNDDFLVRKEIITDYELHPKLIPLFICLAFTVINFVLVS
ncbi:uncharacterized protein [Porites lutea]|uniref:uncharacterized protein n=1 Tax=Porites lutea TaxID=51062 RepID=UPI003CC6A705